MTVGSRSAIARAAGISHGTVFLYFPSKEALFRAAVLEPLEEFAARSLGIMDGVVSPLQRIRTLVREQVRETAAERSYLQVVGEAMARTERFGDLAAEISVIIDRVVLRLAQLVAEGIAAGELAAGEPAHLETDTIDNVRFYRRRGFEVVAQEEPLGVMTWYMEHPAALHE